MWVNHNTVIRRHSEARCVATPTEVGFGARRSTAPCPKTNRRHIWTRHHVCQIYILYNELEETAIRRDQVRIEH